MSDKYAALKAAAEAVKETAHIARYTKAMVARQDFKEAATFDVILALLAEREADKARIAVLQSANAAQDDHINQQQDRIEQLEKGHQEAAKQINSWRRIAKENIAEREKDISALDEARQRIAELEARKLLVNIKQWDEFTVQHFTSCSDDYAAGWVNGRDHAQDEIRKSCAAAGITLETGE